MVSCPAPISKVARADCAPCNSTVCVVCLSSEEKPRRREKPCPCQRRRKRTKTNASVPTVAPVEIPEEALGLRFLCTLSQIFPRPIKIRMRGQYVARIGQGAKAGRQLSKRKSAPITMRRMGTTSDDRLGLPSWAMAHLRYL